ncbi:MAG: DUF4384 domain-containing protein [candidate division Zixibacteria bacterium]|nr:DUF4384 domain-containing protein [candidate division Zixibacteria bacterium]MCI0595047.1 DUF4384 domain-containing protein [candidate division Zixibacteria bacterium]
MTLELMTDRTHQTLAERGGYYLTRLDRKGEKPAHKSAPKAYHRKEKFMKKLFLIFLIGLGMSANGWADDDPPIRDENYAPNRIVPGPKGEPLEIELWADRNNEDTYYEGENITLYFRTNRDAYVLLYNIDAQGNVFLLYPQHPDDPHFVRGGATYELPDRRDDYDLWITGPPGVEFVQAVASLRPFDVPEDWPSYSRSNRASGQYPSSSLRVDDENIEEFIFDLNSRLVPIKRYPDECAEDLFTFYVKPRPHTTYRTVVYDYGYWDFDYPYGSEIWIDGVYAGVGPFYDYGLYPGTHIVRVIQPGYPPYIRHIYVYPRSRFSLSFSFFFDFGYRHHRYYRDYYPYSYFCYISPDYRYKYRHAYYGEARYRDVFRKDVRFKSWVRDAGDRDWGKSKLLGDAVREKRYRDDGKPFIDRGETKKRSTIREVIERNRDGGRGKVRSGDGEREKVSSREERKSKSVYEAWEQSRKGRSGDGDGQVKEKTRYRGWEDGSTGLTTRGKKERSSGNRDEGERYEGSKKERSSGSGYEGSKRERSSRNSDEPQQVERGKKESHRSSEPAKVERSKQDSGGKEGRSRGSSSKKGRDD